MPICRRLADKESNPIAGCECKTHSLAVKAKGLVGSAVMGLLVSSSLALANPEGGQVSAGTATISSPDANTVQVNQTSDKAVINWNSFNVDSNQAVHFNQPSPNAITLNRVNPDNGASKILGSLTANGHIWIINPAGILFGASSRVDAAGLIATTANLSDQDFMAGNYHFVQAPGWNGGVVNEGTLSMKDSGLAVLVAPGVENSGVIRAKLGKVVLAAGTAFTIDFYGDELINFSLDARVDAPAIDPRSQQAMKDGVSNRGAIYADGGSVLMTAKVASGVLDHTINMSGVVEANTIASSKGNIILLGEDDGIVKVTGKLSASGKRAHTAGGTIKVLGNKIEVTDHAYINVAGRLGGGDVLIGGNAHGNGQERNADYTYFGPNARINADAGKTVMAGW